MVDQQSEIDNALQRRKHALSFVVVLIWFFLAMAGYFAVVNLQSSINIEGGIGVISIACAYTVSCIFLILFSPIVLRYCGAKKTITISFLGYFIYIIANFYPSPYTLIPGAAFVGIAEALLWPTVLMATPYYAKLYAKYAKKEAAFYVTEFIGYYWTIFQLSQVFGNLMTYLLLNSGIGVPLDVGAEDNLTTPNIQLNKSNMEEIDFSVCGVNDCQDPNITAINLDQYQPATQEILYLTLGVMLGLLLSAFVIHIFFTKDFTPNDVDKVEEQSHDEDGKVAQDHPSDACSKFELVQHLKRVFSQTIDTQQLLLTPVSVYFGLLYALVFGEVTRAFTSCLLGVDKVGISTVIFCATCVINTCLMGKVASRLGRVIPTFIAVGFDVAAYLTAFLWKPNQNNLVMVYILFLIFGISNSTWTVVITDLYAASFTKNQDNAYSMYTFWIQIGFSLQFAWSTSLCVRTKIYILMGMLFFSIITICLAEIRVKPKPPSHEENQEHQEAI